VIERAGLIAAVEQAADGVVITTPTGKSSTSTAFTAMTGYTSEEAVGQYPRILSRDSARALYQELWNTIPGPGGSGKASWFNRRKDGSVYHEEMRITPVRDPKG